MTFTRLRLLLLIVLGGAVINSMIGAALAIWQPPWRHENAQSDLLGYQRENEQILRERIEFDETFPQRLRRSAHYRATAVGWDIDHYYGDAAMGRSPQLIVEVRVLRTGWPLPSWHGEHRWARYPDSENSDYVTALRVADPEPSAGEGGVEFNFVPFGILPVGFAVNTLIYTVALGSMLFLSRATRRWIRSRRGRCPRCAYPIGTSDTCTECGEALTKRGRAALAVAGSKA
jgi:hypothetical protein